MRDPAVADAAVTACLTNAGGRRSKRSSVKAPGTTRPGPDHRLGRSHIAGYKLPKSVDFVAELPPQRVGKVCAVCFASPTGREIPVPSLKSTVADPSQPNTRMPTGIRSRPNPTGWYLLAESDD